MRRPRRFGLALVLAAVAAGGAACQSAAAPDPASAAEEQTAPAADVAAIRAAIDAVNGAAGGPVDDQQAQLIAHVEPDRRTEVQRCPTATTTVRLAPVDRGLRAVPEPITADSTAPESTAPADSTTYALPTLIRIFTGDRLTGTDLTTLHVVVHHGANGAEAYLTPFCVN